MRYITKKISGRDVSLFSAFEEQKTLSILFHSDRDARAVLHLRRDGEEEAKAYEMKWKGREGRNDLFVCEIMTEKGLWFGEINGFCFRLLIYDKDFTTPDRFKGGILYHIFVDRFSRSGKVKSASYGREIADWYACPEYPEKEGGPLANDTFFGGDLWGIAEKLDYIASLGADTVYLSPIFASPSNHKYDTADYEHVDERFGGDRALTHLIEKAHSKGIRILLDGVFNHCGSDSRYFDQRGQYADAGAAQSKNSPYHSWFTFSQYPTHYDCWWGIGILPKLNQNEPSCREYFLGEGGIVPRYLQKGIDGWRLDVADELSDSFLSELRARAKTVNPDSLILGEVWEDASDKIAYGTRKQYLWGHELDAVMNYPLREEIIAFVMSGNAQRFAQSTAALYSHYPKCVSDCNMNFLSTHDTIRILTLLGGERGEGMSNGEKAIFRLSDEQRQKAIERLKLAYVILFTMPGIPCLFYGDEAGLEGFSDPFNRVTYPWGREDRELIEFVRRLGKLRKGLSDFKAGEYRIVYASGGMLVYRRGKRTIAVNLSCRSRVLRFKGKKRERLSGADCLSEYWLHPGQAAVL